MKKKLLMLGGFVLMIGIIASVSSKRTNCVGTLVLKNVEALSFVEGDGHVVIIPCKEQMRSKCKVPYYDAFGNYVGTETYKNSIRVN